MTILNDLRLFYVNVELVQYYDRMGKMEVALFDVDRLCVMKVIWGDSWNSEEKGYFHTIYYPEGGTSSGDGMGYIYTSFWRRGELKVEDGHVKYEISDGEEELGSGDLGEVANPFRMVKYLVIRPSRASANELIDLRLHDIVLWASQDTSLEEPDEKDGTVCGTVSNQDIGELNPDLDDASDLLLTYWTGPWPELHFERAPPEPSEEVEDITFHVKRDLLDKITVLNFTPASSWDDEDEEEFREEALEELAPFILFSTFMTLCLTAIRYIEATAGVGFLTGLGVAAVAFWILAVLSLRLSIDWWLDTGEKGLGWASWVCFICGAGCLVTAFGGYLAAIPATIISMVYPPMTFFIWKIASALTIHSIAVRLVLIITGLLLLSFALQYRVGGF